MHFSELQGLLSYHDVCCSEPFLKRNPIWIGQHAWRGSHLAEPTWSLVEQQVMLPSTMHSCLQQLGFERASRRLASERLISRIYGGNCQLYPAIKHCEQAQLSEFRCHHHRLLFTWIGDTSIYHLNTGCSQHTSRRAPTLPSAAKDLPPSTPPPSAPSPTPAPNSPAGPRRSGLPQRLEAELADPHLEAGDRLADVRGDEQPDKHVLLCRQRDVCGR